MKKTTMNSQYDLKFFCKFALILLVAYVVLAIGFYYLADEQLHYRESKNNINSVVCESATTELSSGAVVEQSFQTSIQRLEQVSIQIGTYYRQNQGNLKIELYNIDDGTLLAENLIPVNNLIDLGFVPLELPQPFENEKETNLLIRIYSPDGIIGSSVTPMMNSTTKEQNGQLSINGLPVNGTLCFSATGKDYIWLGLHYKTAVFWLGVIIAAYLSVFFIKIHRGQNSFLLTVITVAKKYKFLIKQLVARDFKTKYKRSVLGVFWSFLNPLLMMVVQYIVFSTIFKTDIEYYPVYLLTGIVMFNYFSETCGMALMSIVGNASLITKVYMPKYVYPLSRVLSSAVNLIISLLPLLCVILFVGVPLTKSYFLLVYPLLCLIVFCLGLGMLLSAAMVFFRDTQFLWGVISTIWMYATPIFYPESILPSEFKFVLIINPLYYFITFARTCILQGVSPDPILYGQCFLFAMGMFIIGAVVFKKTQDEFILAL